MSSHITPENEPQIQQRNPFARPGAIPDWRLEGLYVETAPSIVARAESSSTSSGALGATSCGTNDDSGACEKSYGASGSDTTLPIVLGVVIPLGIALIILLYLHRRHVKKLRREDAEDRHKSLDFGLDISKPGNQTGKNYPDMSIASEKETRIHRGRGMSLDMGVQNPYLLPPEVQNSRESLHSLSRSMNTRDDKYRATTFIPDDGSIRTPSSLRSHIDDSSSSYTGSSSRRYPYDSRQNLLPGTTESSGGGLPSGPKTLASLASGIRNPLLANRNNHLLAPTLPDPVRDSVVSTTSTGAINALSASNTYLGQFINGSAFPIKDDSSTKETIASARESKLDTTVVQVQPPQPAVMKDALSAPLPSTSSAPQIQKTPAPSITLNRLEERQPRLPQLNVTGSHRTDQQSFQPDVARHAASVGLKNMPQHSSASSTDLHRDSSLQTQTTKANPRVEDDEDDYYDEYDVQGEYSPQTQDYDDYQDYQNYLGYDNRRSMMGIRPLPPDDPSENPEQRANRIRSFYKEYFEESKPQSQGQNRAQNVQYYDGGEQYYANGGQGGYLDGYYDQMSSQTPHGMSQTGSYGRHRATVSNGGYDPQNARAFSSASDRYARSRMAPAQKLPPPKALHLLPTPAKLKEDTFLPIDFAPPKKFSNQRSGTPDSMRGGLRPYSPKVRAHIPLASSFDDLAVIPSP